MSNIGSSIRRMIWISIKSYIASNIASSIGSSIGCIIRNSIGSSLEVVQGLI